MELLLQAVTGLVISVASSWFTVKLSLARFSKERLWEKKALAYERVIDAIHKAKKFSSEHLDAQYNGRELPDERDEELRKLVKEATDEINRAADIGGFILSSQALEIIGEYERRNGDTKHIESTSTSNMITKSPIIASSHSLPQQNAISAKRLNRSVEQTATG